MTQTATIATVTGKPVSEFLLMSFGYVEVDRALAGGSFTFTRGQAAQAVAWFARNRRPLAIDYEHQSINDLNTRADGLVPAAGWIGRLEVRSDGLWAADVHWTEQARSMLAAGEYRYFSPVIYWRDESHTDIDSLGPVALTNDPAMRGVPALAASREKGQRTMCFMTVLAARPLPGVFTAGGGEARSKAQIIRAIETFAEGVDARSFVAAMCAELIQTIDNAFDEDDREVLIELGNIVCSLRSNMTPRQIAGQLMQEDTQSAASRRGPATAGTSARAALIAAAKRTYAEEKAGTGKVICSEKAWVHTALRDAGYSSLTDAEVARHGIADATVGRSKSRDRATVIALAKRTYAEEAADPGKITICSEKAWIHTALRDAGQPTLTAREAAEYGLVDETLGRPRQQQPRQRQPRQRQPSSTPQDRATVIAVAKRTYAEEVADPGKITICSEKAWIHTALRDAGQKPLTEKELVQYGIRVDR